MQTKPLLRAIGAMGYMDTKEMGIKIEEA
jgi:hypothetical protein